MKEKDLNAEEKILEAAVQEFSLKGRSGARMQEIADKAGINKALLHYYYRSKDKLFESVFSQMVGQLLLPRVVKIIDEEKDIFSLIRKLAHLYVDLMNRNPNLPFFILDEIHKNPGRLSNAFLKAGLPVDRLMGLIHEAVDQQIIRAVDPRHLIVNLISLCVFPVAGRNMMQPIFFKDDKKAFNKFLESRKTEVADFIIQSIQPNK